MNCSDQEHCTVLSHIITHRKTAKDMVRQCQRSFKDLHNKIEVTNMANHVCHWQ